MERMLHEYDTCHCGDYRIQHDEKGCRICRANLHYSPWNRCTGFRLHLVATEVPEFYKRQI